ncbi:hypothetical protein [Maridesulfovibrio sp.]|nr:hypothetical protein [Maridesulfovibrio sp.]
MESFFYVERPRCLIFEFLQTIDRLFMQIIFDQVRINQDGLV